MKFKPLFYYFIVILLASPALGYYVQNGTWEARTRIDHYGQPPTSGVVDTDYVSGGLHPVTADYNAPFTGYIGSFELANVTAGPSPVTSRGGGGGGAGGGGMMITRTHTMDKNPYPILVGKTEKITFMVEGQTHSIMVNNIQGDSVTITVSSTPKRYTLKKGTQIPIDVNGDGHPDITILVNYIVQNKAMITIRLLEPPKQTSFPVPQPQKDAPEPEKEAELPIFREVATEEKDMTKIEDKTERKIQFKHTRLAFLGGLLLMLICLTLLITRKRHKPKPKKPSFDAYKEYQKELERIRKKYDLK